MKGIRKMKTTLTILCAMFAAFAFGAEKKPEPKKTSITESELRTMAKVKPNSKDAGTLYQVGMATNNVERKQEFFKASAACLLACGKYETYKKYVKGKLANAKAFEESLKEKCKQCGGAGKKDLRCYVCSGKGKCPTCRGSGRLVSVGFNRPNGTKPCHRCRGGGKCPKCGGAGSTKAKCGSCTGTGKVFRESVAERVFRDTCIAIADRPAKEARAKVEAAERERKRIAKEKKKKEETEFMESLGLVKIYGKWMTPGSAQGIRFRVVQILGPGRALCTDGNIYFCLIYAAHINQDIAEGYIYTNDLYRCGTYTYTSVENASRTVAKFAIDLDVAIKEIKKSQKLTTYGID